MADPVTATLLVTQAASTVVSAVGAKRQAQAQAGAANYNAQVAEQDATAARQQAQAQAVQIDRENRIRLGRAHASAAAAGIETSANAVDVIGDLVAQGEMERQFALWEGELKARGFTTEASLSRFEARDARRAGRLAVASTLLEGASRAGTTFMRFNPPSGGESG